MSRPWYTNLLSQPINVMVNNMQSRCQVRNQNLYCHCSNKTLNIEKWKCNIVIRYFSVWTRKTIVLFCDIKSVRLCQTVAYVIVCSLMIGQHLYTVRIIATCCTWHHFFLYCHVDADIFKYASRKSLVAKLEVVKYFYWPEHIQSIKSNSKKSF